MPTTTFGARERLKLLWSVMGWDGMAALRGIWQQTTWLLVAWEGLREMEAVQREKVRGGGLLSGLPLTHNVFFGIISCSEDPPSLSALLCSA